MISRLKTKLDGFARKDDGSVAIIFALSVFPFVMAVALSVDIGRAMHMSQKLSDAVDGATLAAAKLVKNGNASDAEVAAQALAYFKANIPGNYAVFKDEDLKVEINRGQSRVAVTLPAYVPTTFARAGGFEKIDVSQKSQVVFALRDIEVGLALDVTGSMGNSPGGGGPRKIDTLKSSFEKFAKLMLPDTPLPGQKVRLGLAPYSASINLGSFAKDVSNNRSTDSCVTERATSARYSDDSLAAGGYFSVAADGKADQDPTEGMPTNAYACPKAVLMPLSSDRKALIDSVKAYKEGGWTGGHFGAQWAWNLVSPEWGSTWGGTSRPDPYSQVNARKLIKAVILMTDGVFNTAYHNDDSAKQAIRLCDEMKSKGVLVFALAFDAPPAAKATLEQCASPGAEYYADASSAAELDRAFAQFAGKINGLRLAQ